MDHSQRQQGSDNRYCYTGASTSIVEDTVIRLVICLLGLCLLPFTAATAETLQLTLKHDGLVRSYQLYLPESRPADARLPLLLALHGRAGDGARMARLTGFDQRAERHGFIVAYPNSLQNHWNYLHGIPGAQAGPDDVDFLVALTRVLSAAYPVDSERVYATGISNGGFMAQRLACEADGPIAAFASVAAGGFGVMPKICRRIRPIDALYIHGTEDRTIPWAGAGVRDGQGNQQTVALPVSSSLKYWADRNGCNPDVSMRELPAGGLSPGTRVRIIETRECVRDARVALYAVLGGGHNWPGVEGVIAPAVAGAVNLDIHASDVIWSFFSNRTEAP